MLILKQSTSIDIRIGPFMDAVDGVTPETGLTLAGADQAEVLKANGAATATMAGAFVAVSGSDGWYDYTAATGDVDTIGEIVFVVQDTSISLPVFVRAQVVEGDIYDAFYGSGATLAADIALIKADTDELQGDWVNAGRLDAILDLILVDTGTTLDTKINDIQGATFVTGTDSLEAIRNRGDAAWQGGPTISAAGTAVAGSTTTLTEEAGQESPNNALVGQLLHITSGTGAPQAKAIEGNVFATGVITIIGTWPGLSPDATSVYQVTPADIDEITNPPAASVIADAVWDENTTGHTTAGTFGEQCKNDIDAILTDTGDMQPKFGAPAVSLAADVAAIKAETVLILADTDVIGTAGAGLTGLGGMSASMKAEVNAEVDTALDTAIGGSPTADSINQRVRSMDLLVETSGAGDLAAILVDTATTIPGLVTGLNDLSAADVNAQMLDVLNVDTYVEPGQGLPPADASIAVKINYLYKAWRNRSNQTATLYQLFGDDATTVHQKATVSDDATTAEKGEVEAGP